MAIPNIESLLQTFNDKVDRPILKPSVVSEAATNAARTRTFKGADGSLFNYVNGFVISRRCRRRVQGAGVMQNREDRSAKGMKVPLTPWPLQTLNRDLN